LPDIGYLCDTVLLKSFMEQLEKIEIALQSIRPFLQRDGGDVELVEVTKDNVVRVRLLGACESCSMSTMTLRAGIEEAVKNAIPEVKSVEAV
jgi:Fe-S cluster biogenesis protein NfuA